MYMSNWRCCSVKNHLFILCLIFASWVGTTAIASASTFSQVYLTGYGSTGVHPAQIATQWGLLDSTTTPAIANITQFNPALGTLKNVVITVKTEYSVNTTVTAVTALTGNWTAGMETYAYLPGLDPYYVDYANDVVLTSASTPSQPLNLAPGATATFSVTNAVKSFTLDYAVNGGILTLAPFIGTGNIDSPVANVNGIGLKAINTYTIINGGGTGNWAFTNKAGVRVSVQYEYDAVPEPSTYILLGLSLGCVGFVRHRMTRDQAPLSA